MPVLTTQCHSAGLNGASFLSAYLPISRVHPVSNPHCMPIWLLGPALIILETLGINLSSAIAPANVPWVGLVCSMPVAIIPLNSSSIASLFGCMFFVVLGFNPYTKISSLWIHAFLSPPYFMLISISFLTFSTG